MASTYTRALVGACALAFTLGSPHIAHAGNGDKTPLSTTLRHRVTSSKRWTRERGNEIRRYSEHKNVRVELRRPLFRFRGKLVTLPMFSEKAAARRLAAGKPVGLQVRGSSMMMGSGGGPPLSVGFGITAVSVVTDQAGVKTWFDNVGRPAMQKRARSLRKDKQATVKSTLDPVQLELPFDQPSRDRGKSTRRNRRPPPR
ncbi:MAG: hypothetical protein KC503_23800 [Myxococcales bacterium]|nr:hypothetical protein [Myxococcales bacterium]